MFSANRPARGAWIALVAALVVGASGAAAQVRIGAWRVSIQGAGDGRPVKTAILLAPDGASLIASCDSAGVDLLLSLLEPLPNKPQSPVQWRVDGGPAHRQAWRVEADHSSLSPGGSEADADLLRQLGRGRTLAVTVAGRRSTFDLTGARQVADLIGDCPMARAPATQAGAGGPTPAP